MSMMANGTATHAMHIRVDDGLEHKGATPRQSGALAGQFAAMLETLNGVGEAQADGANATPVTPLAQATAPAVQSAVRVGIGAVSLFAQEAGEGEEGAQTPDVPQQDPNAAHQVVESALQAGDGANVRWLTTLLTQNTET